MTQFIKKQINSTHEITIGVEFASRIIEIEHDTNVKLQIWDTAGQEAFRSVTRSYYRGAICVILVYDITRRKSFTNIKKWLEDVKDYGYNKVLTVLIGNKSDLDDKRQVS
jgi:small GTP-binding protein